MLASNSEQAVKMRYDMAGQMRRRARETPDSYYRRLFEYAALELELSAEALERAAWRPPLRPVQVS